MLPFPSTPRFPCSFLSPYPGNAHFSSRRFPGRSVTRECFFARCTVRRRFELMGPRSVFLGNKLPRKTTSTHRLFTVRLPRAPSLFLSYVFLPCLHPARNDEALGVRAARLRGETFAIIYSKSRGESFPRRLASVLPASRSAEYLEKKGWERSATGRLAAKLREGREGRFGRKFRMAPHEAEGLVASHFFEATDALVHRRMGREQVFDVEGVRNHHRGNRLALWSGRQRGAGNPGFQFL